MNGMTHREYQKCIAFYTEKYSDKPKKKKSVEEKASEEVTFGPPVFELNPVSVAKSIWAGRLNMKDVIR